MKSRDPLSVTHPEIAVEADGWDPSKYTYGSSKKLKWKCSKGHTWESKILNRTVNNSGCPICSNSKVVSGVNDLATTHPEVAEKADGWDPAFYTFGSGSRVNWKCNKGHTWSGTIQSQARKNGCPVCSNHKIISGINDFATTHPQFIEEVFGWDPRPSWSWK